MEEPVAIRSSRELHKGLREDNVNNIKALFLAANPSQTSQLALDEEIREITQKIRLSDHGDSIQIISKWAVRPDDLLQSLNQHKPRIVHFSGHGSVTGEIILLDDHGNAKPVAPRGLKALFTTLRDNIELVVLNTCYSKIQAREISEVIDFVVGMNTAISDDAAIVFAAAFYRALGFNRTIQEAFDQARVALLLEGIPEESTPELLINKNANPDRSINPDIPTHSQPDGPGVKSSGSASSLWREKLEFLREQEAIASDPAQKYSLKKQIEEALHKISTLT